jgi:hypothetical protein
MSKSFPMGRNDPGGFVIAQNLKVSKVYVDDTIA